MVEGTLGVSEALVGPVVDVGPRVDEGKGVWLDREEEDMSALGDMRGGIGALDMMITVGKGRRIEEVGGAVEVWTHRWSSGNGGNCKEVGGSIDNCSNTFIASLIDKRKLCCVGTFDRAYVGFEEIGFDLESSEVADVEELHKPLGSSSRNRQFLRII